jgi:prepilin-type N-terminal cleavage/methylation domain-containing protein
MKMKIMKDEKGFSLIEMLITASVFLIVLAGVYMMVFHYADVSRTEQSRRRMQQESRFLTSHFASELKNAGAALTYYGKRFSRSENLLDPDAISGSIFNGIYPLNSSSVDLFPDGIIIATGDHEAVTFLIQDFTPGDESLIVESTRKYVYDTYETPMWKAGDKGILLDLDSEGYYVFSVTEVPDDNTLTIRSIPVYYSGLLLTYPDLEKQKLYQDVSAPLGNAFTYEAPKQEKKTSVIRLDNFAIYLFREVEDRRYDAEIRRIRQLVRVTDAMDDPDVLAESSLAERSVISENIWDMQITYTVYDDFATATPDTTTGITEYFADPYSTDPLEFNKLMTALQHLTFKKLNITIVSLSDEFSGEGEVKHRVPAIGDQNWYYLHPGKFSMNILSMEIEPRNYNINR